MKSMINWFGIPTSDFDRAVKFYSTIFDIEMILEEEGDHMVAYFFDPKEGMSGCIHSDPSIKPGKDGPRIYLNAQDKIDEVLSRVEEAGGFVATPKQDAGKWGSIALIVDSEGNYIGLHST